MTSSKTRSTYYTPAKVAAARQNVETYNWARSMKDSVVAKADRYLTLGYEQLWQAVPPQTIPRSYGVNQKLGSPVAGTEINKYGNYPWVGDPINEPWKLTDPSSGFKFPTNDFGAYYRSGLDTDGVFKPALADGSLLVNTLYPEKGPTWGVDNGYGWVDEKGNRWTFIAYYTHWYLWYGGGALILSALNSFRNAYLYTGDVKYARAGAIVLDRVADIYPSLDVAALNKNIYLNSHGGTGLGKAIGSIWETALVKDFISAYDAFYPAMDDPEITAFLKAQGEKYHLPYKTSSAEIKQNIEDGILRQVYPGVKNAQIRGNNGFHQSALAMAAVVFDTFPETKEWLDFNFQAGGFVNNKVTGGNIWASLVGDVDRDGNGNESAPGYNRLWLSTYQVAADILDGYDKYAAADLYENVKFRKMFSALYPLTLVERYTAQIGDSGSTGNPELLLNKEEVVKAFEKYGDPIYAQLAYFLNNNRTDGIHGDIFSPDPDKVTKDIEAVIRTEGPLNLKSSNMTGYGFTALRDAERDVWMYYGRSSGHGHRDTLNLGMHAFGLDLAPDLGYPEFADSTNTHRSEWMNNTISHNTVVVDRAKQPPQWVGFPRHFDDSGQVKLFDVEATQVYPQTEMYRRTTAMIKVDYDNSYIVDFFRVKGGSDHHFSFHAAEGTVSTDGLSLTPQGAGTYAGMDVAYGQRVDSVAGTGYMGSGFHYLHHVERDSRPDSTFSVDWEIKDTWKVLKQDENIHLRLTMLDQVDDVALADGIPPQNKAGNPQSLRYLIAHRNGQNLSSVFTSVIEPYKKERYVDSIAPAVVKADGAEADDVEARAVKVTLKNGRIDYIVNALNPDITYTIDDIIEFKGFLGVYSEANGQQVYSYVNDGSLIGRIGSSFVNEGPGSLNGTIVDFTKELSLSNEIIVQINSTPAGQEVNHLVGRTIYVDNDGIRNAAYLIKGVSACGGGMFKLDIGDATTVRGYIDSNDFSKGFVYDMAAGAAFRIPLSVQWN